jgi:hypothetical protein
MDPDAMTDAPIWAQMVYAVVTVLVASFLLPFLRRLAEKARAEAEQAAQNSREKLVARLKEVALDGAYVIAEERFPKIAAWILKNKGSKPSVDDVKNELKSWGSELKDRLVVYFRNEGIDIVKEVGDAMLDNVVRWAADKTSPFPGKETAVSLLIDDWTNRLMKFGTDWVRDHWLRQKDQSLPEPAKK